MHNKKLRILSVLVFGVTIIILGAVLFGFIFIKHASNSQYRAKTFSWATAVNIDEQKLYSVTDVVDGDTLKTMIDGHEVTVRLLGINTPEVVDPRKPIQCYGKEASSETKSLLTGKSIYIELNPNYDRVDKYGRLLAYVKLPSNSSSSTDLFVNKYLVSEGYAYEYTYDYKNPYMYQREFKDSELKAKQANKGLWKKCVNTNQ